MRSTGRRRKPRRRADSFISKACPSGRHACHPHTTTTLTASRTSLPTSRSADHRRSATSNPQGSHSTQGRRLTTPRDTHTTTRDRRHVKQTQHTSVWHSHVPRHNSNTGPPAAHESQSHIRSHHPALPAPSVETTTAGRRCECPGELASARIRSAARVGWRKHVHRRIAMRLLRRRHPEPRVAQPAATTRVAGLRDILDE